MLLGEGCAVAGQLDIDLDSAWLQPNPDVASVTLFGSSSRDTIQVSTSYDTGVCVRVCASRARVCMQQCTLPPGSSLCVRAACPVTAARFFSPSPPCPPSRLSPAPGCPLPVRLP